jgi:hypothetical protein
MFSGIRVAHHATGSNLKGRQKMTSVERTIPIEVAERRCPHCSRRIVAKEPVCGFCGWNGMGADFKITKTSTSWSTGQIAMFALISFLFPLVAVVACVITLCRDGMDKKAAIFALAGILGLIVIRALFF